MDDAQFDVLTRAVVSGAGTRRAVARLLVSSALGAVVARLGLDADAAAKPKRRPAQSKRQKSGHHEAHTSHGRPRTKDVGAVHSERKHKGKGNRKGKHHPPPPPSGVCDNGHPRCPDGSCASAGQCCPGSRRCGDDGFCHSDDECCSNEKRCADDSCVSVFQCCPDEQRCDDGSCVAADACCSDMGKCPDGSCVPFDQCCPDERRCLLDETCIPADQCCSHQKKCANGLCVGESECCPDEKLCGGECIPKIECCQLAYPLCDRGCNFIQCVDGEWECHPRPFGDYCLMPWYDPGVCCKGRCRPGWCERDGGHYEPNTCSCIKP
jgi:hypothetical protein